MRERLLLDREKMLLPETQDIAEREKRARQLEEIQKKNVERLTELMKNVAAMKETIAILNVHIVYTRNPRNPPSRAATDKGPKTLFGCPVGDCRGFITSDGHKCGLCGTKLCKKCEQILVADAHECKQSDVDTVTTVRKETKPCPKCFIAIYKIDGCDQMWCTECKTPFSWITGLEVHERIHNPHFYEWQRKNGGGVAPRVPGDDGGCGEIRLRSLMAATESKNILLLHQFVGHMLAVVPRPQAPDNLDLRVEYLLGELSEESFARKVQQRDKKREKETEIRQIVDVFCQATTDIFRKIINEAALSRARIKKKSEEVYNAEFTAIIDFVNGQLSVVAQKYSSKKKQIIVDVTHEGGPTAPARVFIGQVIYKFR